MNKNLTFFVFCVFLVCCKNRFCFLCFLCVFCVFLVCDVSWPLYHTECEICSTIANTQNSKNIKLLDCNFFVSRKIKICQKQKFRTLCQIWSFSKWWSKKSLKTEKRRHTTLKMGWLHEESFGCKLSGRCWKFPTKNGFFSKPYSLTNEYVDQHTK